MADIINTSGAPLTSVGIGSKVMLRGDVNSPVMTCIGAVLAPNNQIVGFACGWFTPSATGDAQASVFNLIQVASETLEVVPLPS